MHISRLTSLSKHLPHPIHGDYEGVDFGHRIVESKGGAHGAGDAHALHQGLGTMMAGAHGYAEAVEHRSQSKIFEEKGEEPKLLSFIIDK